MGHKGEGEEGLGAERGTWGGRGKRLRARGDVGGDGDTMGREGTREGDVGRRGAGGDPVGKGMGGGWGLVGGPPPLTTAPGSRRSCADSPRLSASRRYSPGSCRHFSLLELSDPASAQGHSTYGCHRVTPHTSNNPPTPPPSTLPTRGGGVSASPPPTSSRV